MKRVELQGLIKKKYGAEIKEARKRLCNICAEATLTVSNKFYSCGRVLLPICSDGSDCPYFDRRKVK